MFGAGEIIYFMVIYNNTGIIEFINTQAYYLLRQQYKETEEAQVQISTGMDSGWRSRRIGVPMS